MQARNPQRQRPWRPTLSPAAAQWCGKTAAEARDNEATIQAHEDYLRKHAPWRLNDDGLHALVRDTNDGQVSHVKVRGHETNDELTPVKVSVR
jgi:hypothetical protein